MSYGDVANSMTTTNLTELKRRLQSYLLLKQPAKIAEMYRAIVEKDPDFCLLPGTQFDMGRLLEQSGSPDLALRAYETLMAKHPRAPISSLAQLQAARICATLPGQDERGRHYVETFLRSSPADTEREEALKLMTSFGGERATFLPRPEAHQSMTPASGQQMPPPPSPPPSVAPYQPPQGGAGSRPDAGVKSNSQALPSLSSAPGEIHLNLDKIQQSFDVSASDQSSNLSFDDEKSEVAGHDIVFEYSQDKSDAFEFSRPRDHFDDAVAELGDEPAVQLNQAGNDSYPGLNDQTPPTGVPLNAAYRPVSSSGIPVPPETAGSPPSAPPDRPQTSSQFLRRADELQQQYDDLRRQNELVRQARHAAAGDEKFAIALPLHRPIHPKRIAHLLAPYLERTPQQILEIMKNGKGIIFDNLDISSFQDLVKITRPVSPDLLFVQISSKLQFNPPIDVLRLELANVGGRAISQDRDVPFHWGEALLVGVGRVYLDELRRAGKNVLDIFLTRENLHLRIWDATFHYKASGCDYDPLGDRNFIGLVSRLSQTAPGHIRFSPTVLRMLERNESMPQRFESVNSYDRYNRWLLFNYYGKRVKI